MADVVLQRMNFLKAAKPSLTYKSLIFIMAGWLALLMVFYAGSLWRTFTLKQDVAKRQSTLSDLEQKKEERMASLSGQRTRQLGKTAQEELLSIFSESPRWSLILADLAQRMPRQLWLQSLAIAEGKGDQATTNRVTLVGKTLQAKNIANFVAKLKESLFFRGGTIVETKRLTASQETFEFTVESELK